VGAIDQLDVDEINNFPKMSDSAGKGTKIHEALEAYRDRLYTVISNGFYDDDSSTAHEVIDALAAEMTVILSLLDNVDVLFDEQIQTISDDVIGKEDQLATTIVEG